MEIRNRSLRETKGTLLIALGLFSVFGGGTGVLLVGIGVIKEGLGVYATLGLLLGGGSLGVVLIRRGKRLRAQGALDVLARDPRPPVVYLRSFKADERAAMDAGDPMFFHGIQFSVTTTEEEQIAKVVRRLGPMVAIGRPNETLPMLGAARMYVADEEWQQRVHEMTDRAVLILMRAGKTEGFWWEVETVIGKIGPARLIWLVPFSKANYTEFATRANRHLPKPIPLEAGEMKEMAGSIRGWIWFEDDWTPHLEKVTSDDKGPQGPVAYLMQRILEPVLVRIGQGHLALRCAMFHRILASTLDFGLVLLVSYGVILLLPQSVQNGIGGLVVLWVIVSGYFMLLDLPCSKGTIGKRLMKLQVVDRQGKELSRNLALVRGAVKCLPSILFGPAMPLYFLLDAYPALFSMRKFTLHDMVTRTLVIGPKEARLITNSDAHLTGGA